MARARYVLLLFLVTQISQMAQIFLRGIIFCPTDFTDLHRFFFVELFCPTDFTDLHRFFMESLVNRFVRSQGVSATTEQVASAKFRVIR